MILKDQENKKAHQDSAQLACEAAGSIRTVASLTREDSCVQLYSLSLEGPLRTSKKASIWGNLLYAFAQSLNFFVVALIFWYGAVLVSRREATIFQFFIGLLVNFLRLFLKLVHGLILHPELDIRRNASRQRFPVCSRRLLCKGFWIRYHQAS